MSSSGKKSEPLWASLTSGTVAGAVEGAVTYPADFVKTQVQFHGSKGGKVRRAPSQLLPLGQEPAPIVCSLKRGWT
jgi:hypothetical protein